MAQKYGPKIVTDGLVLCLDAADKNSYPGSGTIWSDLSGNGNDGTLTNGPTYNGSSIVFDGVNDYVDCGNDSILGITNAITVEAWAKPAVGTVSSNNIVTKRDNSNIGGYIIHNASPNILRVYVYTNTWHSVDSSSDVYSQDTWTHVAMTYDGNNLKAYANGAEVGSTSLSGAINNNANASVTIGGWAENNRQYWTGAIGDVRIYNRALTAAEVLQNYNAHKSRFSI